MERFGSTVHHENEPLDTNEASLILAVLQGRVDELTAVELAIINAHVGSSWSEGLALRNVKERSDGTYVFEDGTE